MGICELNMTYILWSFVFENRTLRSDPTKGGLSIGNAVEVDLPPGHNSSCEPVIYQLKR